MRLQVMLGVQKGTGVTLVCPKCDYKVVYTGGTLVTCPYDGEALVLADLAGVHAEKVPSGIGRKDLPGYIDNSGTAHVSKEGKLKFVAHPCWLDVGEQESNKFTLTDPYNLNINIQNFFNKKMEDLPEPTPTPSPTPEPSNPTPSPSPSPAPLDPILPETQNLIIPKMNSNSFADEHGTWIASGSSKYSDVFDFFHAFDRSTSDFWETNTSPSYLQIEIPDPQNYYVDGYIMRISKFTNRYAKEWTLQGSDDGETWDDLDTQKDQNLSDMQEHKYTLTLRKAYKYYRLNMSNYASSMCSLSHFNLLGYDAKDVVTPTPAPTDPPSPSPAPDPGTDPTPVPTPGGGTVPAPGGDSNISGGDDEGLFGWIWDLLKDIVKSILKAIFKIIANILGFLIWIVERVGLLLPFLPGPAVAALGAGVVLVFVIRIIRFIRG